MRLEKFNVTTVRMKYVLYVAFSKIQGFIQEIFSLFLEVPSWDGAKKYIRQCQNLTKNSV